MAFHVLELRLVGRVFRDRRESRFDVPKGRHAARGGPGTAEPRLRSDGVVGEVERNVVFCAEDHRRTRQPDGAGRSRWIGGLGQLSAGVNRTQGLGFTFDDVQLHW